MVDEWYEAAEEFGAEYAEERFAELARFLFARTDPLLLDRSRGCRRGPGGAGSQ
ncbi:hypothetical protein ACFVJM_37840 [Streptomyces virginiae]|uniref:hypothetical protein n=1 Tax=Streptomyces virginiae TaxID=1961 RepID=UPI003641BF13